jgi:hypothetical protein
MTLAIQAARKVAYLGLGRHVQHSTVGPSSTTRFTDFPF